MNGEPVSVQIGENLGKGFELIRNVAIGGIVSLGLIVALVVIWLWRGRGKMRA